MEELILDRNSFKPLYQQLTDHLREQIRRGDLSPGARLPSVREMMKTYRLASITVQKALGRLKSEGLIAGKAGEGTVVVKTAPDAPLPEGKPELWVESFDLYDGNREEFLNRFLARRPQLKIAKRDVGNDICWVGMDFLPKMARSLEDVTELVLKQYGRAGGKGGVFEKLFVDGRLYMLPMKINLSVVACNVRVFEEMGVPLPDPNWDWDDFLRIGRALTRAREGRYGLATRRDCWDSFVPAVWQAGGAVFEPDGSRCLLDSPQVIEAARFLRAWREMTAPAPSAAFMETFLQDKAAMTTVGVGGYCILNEKGCRWAARPLPQATVKAVAFTASGYGLSRRSRHRSYALEFLRESAECEAWPERRAKRSALPLHQSLELSGENERTYRAETPHSRALLSDIEPECRRPVHRVLIELITTYHLRDLLTSDRPVEAVLRSMTDLFNSLLTQAESDFARA